MKSSPPLTAVVLATVRMLLQIWPVKVCTAIDVASLDANQAMATLATLSLLLVKVGVGKVKVG